ncbi:MAG: hypothetical protein IPO53_09430 [Chitinophagaceae bacterium]|nr:hypothetical protein [Chitinophagaceae bacterium]
MMYSVFSIITWKAPESIICPLKNQQGLLEYAFEKVLAIPGQLKPAANGKIGAATPCFY